jgi:16S rRNA (guanine966-N2)-methyltransferase
MRVVAGELRGRRLASAAGRQTRPTSERARAGLFDWLGEVVIGARVLDLFAGCGALGIEALSRGAAHACFVEQSRAAASALRTNLRQLALERVAEVRVGDVGRVLAALGAEPFDLILADPPYASDWGERLVADARLLGLLAPGATLVVERSARAPSPESAPGLVRVAQRRFGETAFDRYQRREGLA